MKTKLKNICLSFVLALSVTAYILSQESPHVITFYFRPLPPTFPATAGKKKSFTPAQPKKDTQPQISETLSTMSEKAKTPFTALANEQFIPPNAHTGIYASYAGMFDRSNEDGQIIFERKTAETKLIILITEDINAVPIDPKNPKTILGFALDPSAHSAHYVYERLQDPETEFYEWHVTKMPTPKNKRIPYDTIIIFANPKHIIIPIGTTRTQLSENLLLPDFYVIDDKYSADNSLRFLKIRQYFAPVDFERKYLQDGYQELLKR